MRGTIAPKEEFGVPTGYGTLEGIPVFRLFREGFAEMMRLRSDSIDRKPQVVGCDGAGYVGRKGGNAGDGFGGCGVFEDDTKFGESRGEGLKVSEEVFLRVEDGDVLGLSGGSMTRKGQV